MPLVSVPGRSQPPWESFHGSQGEHGGCTGGETEPQTGRDLPWVMQQGSAERGGSRVLPPSPTGPQALRTGTAASPGMVG